MFRKFVKVATVGPLALLLALVPTASQAGSVGVSDSFSDVRVIKSDPVNRAAELYLSYVSYAGPSKFRTGSVFVSWDFARIGTHNKARYQQYQTTWRASDGTIYVLTVNTSSRSLPNQLIKKVNGRNVVVRCAANPKERQDSNNGQGLGASISASFPSSCVGNVKWIRPLSATSANIVNGRVTATDSVGKSSTRIYANF